MTPAGLVVADWATRLLDVAQEIDAGLGSLRKEGRERIRVSASQTVSEQLMPHWLLSCRPMRRGAGDRAAGDPDRHQQRPRDRLGARWLRRPGFVENPGTPKGLGSCVVGEDELVIVVPPDHKWARRSRIVTARELAQTPLVSRELHSGIRDSLAAALRQVLGEDMQQAAPVLELTSSAAMRAAVLAARARRP
ncbi:hypothetical protein MTIM_52610 [Mycobacterium timonense]|uniref:LysR substrate-binding domain-containing protein n=1 Tax=Mycobacterium timonense TaxID=701043 RepID=A0A7I9ZF08_9MYCO|nr:hypothetical protein MTIM_52610 [Mycobacterium timonense]